MQKWIIFSTSTPQNTPRNMYFIRFSTFQIDIRQVHVTADLMWAAAYHIIPYCTVLYCTVPYHTVLYCTVLYCTVLYCTVLYYTVLYCTVLYCTVPYCTIPYCTILYCTIPYCTVPYHTTNSTHVPYIWRERKQPVSISIEIT